MGASKLTLGGYGCTTCCVSMVSAWYGEYVSPDKLAKSKALYTTAGLIIWQALGFLKFKFSERFYSFRKDKIDEALASSSKTVILQVNNDHWVWAIGKWLPVLGYRIIDPWTGSVCYSNRYRNNITGGAIFDRK
jgi:hypothetical protein